MRLFTHSSRWRITSTAFLGAAMVASILTACSNSTSTSGGGTGAANGKGCTKVGVLLPESDTSARWEGKDHPLLKQEITRALPGVTLDFSNANNSAATQLNQTETALTKGDCILVVAPQDSQKAATIVQKAKAQNVPVIAYDRLIQDNDTAYYVSFDNVSVGKLQGDYVAAHYKNFVQSRGTNNLVMINGSQTDNNAILFHDGAHQALDPLIKSKALNKVYEQYTPDWNNNTAQSEMDAALTAAKGKVAVAYVANDGMAGTVIAALKSQGLSGKVLVTGQDATVTGIQNILLGTQAMTVYKAITKEAKATAQLVAAISKGTSTSAIVNGTTKTTTGGSLKSVLETPVAVDKSNIKTTVLADGFVTKQEICQGVPKGTDGIC